MSAAHATFGLAPATRAGGLLADGGHQLHRDFLDFVVDGRPLLLRLPSLDAVSPLALDVPPALFTARVRGLLLETGAPLPGGRFVLYGCPECADLACGAVTAVIERDGDDYVWRDFARQSDDDADPDFDGYHGVGPFRFHGPEYRAALGALLDGDGPPPRRRVLLIGARAALLARLAAALRSTGIGADITPGIDDVPAEELRPYGAVAFGPALGEDERAAARRVFERAGNAAVFVEGLAPIVPLLVAQVEQALDRSPVAQRRLTGLAADCGAAEVEVASPCRVRLTAYRLDRLSRTRAHEVFDGVLQTGRHRIALDAETVKGQAFVVARTSASVLVAAVTRRETRLSGGRPGR
ncbi:oxidoreductase [Streptomyces sp. NPDC020298]|uniref:oxidoreductase n=1 Tax=unclassified Streptomyces TaxID=2593676 RepID=UPI0033DECE42